MADLDDDVLLAIVAVCLKKKERREKKKRPWMRNRQENRNKVGPLNLLNELKFSSPNDFRNLLHINSSTYEELLGMIGPFIKKRDTNMREAISASLRFSTTLHFLINGGTFDSLKFKTRMSSCAAAKIIIETCEAIISCLKEYIKQPETEEEWKAIADEFNEGWNIPNCLGVVAGKHIAIKKPTGSGTFYYNYSGFYSLAFMAVVNAKYEFIMADIGTSGSLSNEGVFQRTSFGNTIYENSLNIPEPNILPASENIVPYVFVGDNAFELAENFMVPFEQNGITRKQRIYNYRMSRALSVAENTLEILSTRFGVFRSPLNLVPKKVQLILTACCYLHNFLRRKTQDDDFIKDIIDKEYSNSSTFVKGSYRKIFEFTPLERAGAHFFDDNANRVREGFMEFFNNEGKVPMQNQMVR